jgi:ferredoxin/flavodoxin---NADP+ reductase
MPKIIDKKQLNENNFEFQIESPEIAAKAAAGQFIIIRIDEKGERVPMTIADWDKNSITMVVTTAGDTSRAISKLNIGDEILDLAGPLGVPGVIKNYGTVVLVGGGSGTAAIHPEAKALKAAGNKVITIIGARSKDLLIWEDKMKLVSDELITITDDGSSGKKGLVTDALKEIMAREKINHVIAIGPVIMMKFVSLTTLEQKIPTTVSLNPIMVDGIGMCGACRVTIDGKTKFACSDGPEFDGHKVDWDNLINRNTSFDHKCTCKEK